MSKIVGLLLLLLLLLPLLLLLLLWLLLPWLLWLLLLLCRPWARAAAAASTVVLFPPRIWPRQQLGPRNRHRRVCSTSRAAFNLRH